MGPKRCTYSERELDDAVNRVVLNGETVAAVASATRMPLSTLRKYVRLKQKGITVVRKRRGTKPALPPACEQELVTWIMTMSREGTPVGRDEILRKGNQLYRTLYADDTRVETPLGFGWYRRFKDRHMDVLVAHKAHTPITTVDENESVPQLSMTRVLNEVTPEETLVLKQKANEEQAVEPVASVSAIDVPLKLFLLLVDDGSVFSLDIDSSAAVDELKDKIKKKKPNAITCDADQLTLFPAQRNGQWLSSNDEDVSQMKKRQLPENIQRTCMYDGAEMDPTWEVGDYFQGKNTPKKREIHVLVQLPK